MIGHRGAAARAPENTLAGMRRAADIGVAWVEIDARLSRDGEIVVFHDADVKRITGADGRVGETPLSVLAGLDAGRHFGPAFAGEPIPTLAALLELTSGLGLRVNVELKIDRGRESELARGALAVIAEKAPPGAILLSSFDAAVLAEAARLDPALPRGLIAERPERAADVAAELGCVSVHLNQRGLGPRPVRRLKEAGFVLAAFTVNEAARARTLWDWGVDALFSDVPDVLLAARRT